MIEIWDSLNKVDYYWFILDYKQYLMVMILRIVRTSHSKYGWWEKKIHSLTRFNVTGSC